MKGILYAIGTGILAATLAGCGGNTKAHVEEPTQQRKTLEERTSEHRVPLTMTLPRAMAYDQCRLPPEDWPYTFDLNVYNEGRISIQFRKSSSAEYEKDRGPVNINPGAFR